MQANKRANINNSLAHTHPKACGKQSECALRDKLITFNQVPAVSVNINLRNLLGHLRRLQLKLRTQ